MVFDLTISILKLCRYYFINFKRNLSHKIHRFFQKYKMICFIIKNYFYWKKHFFIFGNFVVSSLFIYCLFRITELLVALCLFLLGWKGVSYWEEKVFFLFFDGWMILVYELLNVSKLVSLFLCSEEDIFSLR